MEVSHLSFPWTGTLCVNDSTFGHGAREWPVSGLSQRNFVVEFFLSAIVFVVFSLVFQRLNMASLRRPPRLSVWEFLFQTYVLRRHPTVVLHNLVKRYGPVMHVRLWSQDLLVLSSVAAVEEFYKLLDMEFGARPSSMGRVTLSNTISYSCFPALATYWKHLRLVLDMTTSTPFDKSSTCGIEWALEELHSHPRVVAHLCEEVKRNLEPHLQIEGSDIARLPYLQAVVKELFRLHPPCAFSFPHESLDEYCNLFGFEVLPRTQVLINIYALQRDPVVWANPDAFEPARFVVHPEVDMQGQHYQLVPFGGGRRQCPGMKLAIRYVQLGLARYFRLQPLSSQTDDLVKIQIKLGRCSRI